MTSATQNRKQVDQLRTSLAGALDEAAATQEELSGGGAGGRRAAASSRRGFVEGLNGFER